MSEEKPSTKFDEKQQIEYDKVVKICDDVLEHLMKEKVLLVYALMLGQMLINKLNIYKHQTEKWKQHLKLEEEIELSPVGSLELSQEAIEQAKKQATEILAQNAFNQAGNELNDASQAKTPNS